MIILKFMTFIYENNHISIKKKYIRYVQSATFIIFDIDLNFFIITTSYI
jgi:hypothetical protein